MKKQIIMLISMTILAIILCSATSAADINENSQNQVTDQSQQTFQNETTISGVVTRCDNGDPFPGVTVNVENNGNIVATTTTNDDGLYSATFVSEDKTFKVTASYPGHISQSKEITLDDSTANANFQLGTVIYVGPTRTYTTIQSGINAAPAGATVLVDPATYTENVNIGKTLTVKANGAVTLTGGTSTNSVVTITASNVTFEGFTLISGNNNDYGIRADGDNVTIKNNNINIGSPISVIGKNAIIVGNTVVAEDYAIYANKPIKISGNTVTTTGNGNAISISDSNSIISDNTINAKRYGIYLNGGSPTITGNTIYSEDTAITVNGDGTPLISGNKITGNNDEWNTGIYTDTDGMATITNNIIINMGTGIRPFGKATISGNTLQNNKYGIWIMTYDDTRINIIINTIINNQEGIHIDITHSQGQLADNHIINIHFNRIVSNTQYSLNISIPSYQEDSIVQALDAAPTAVIDATNNWWGTNNDPRTQSATIYDPNNLGTTNPWLILSISASPNSIPFGSTSKVTADVTHNNLGQDTSALGHIPDGTPITITTDIGNVGSKSVELNTINGIVSTILRADDGFGTAHLYAILDGFKTPVPAQVVISGATVNAKTVGMQETGIPIAGLVLAVLMFTGGLVTSRR